MHKVAQSVDTVNDTGAGFTTDKVVAALLRENTGRNICDSGDAYGRHWERNQKADFKSRPKVTSDFDIHWDTPQGVKPYGSILLEYPNVDLYHWMVDHLDYDPVVQASFNEFCESHPDNYPIQNMEMFAKQVNGRHGGFTAVNTYNESDDWDLSQVLQFVVLCDEDDGAVTHMIIQVHNGADVRGGYTSPWAFKLKAWMGFYQLLEYAKVRAVFARGQVWEITGSYPLTTQPLRGDPGNLEDIPAVRLADAYSERIDDTLRALEDTGTIEQAREALAKTTLTPQQQEASIKQIVSSTEQLQKTLQAEYLKEWADLFLSLDEPWFLVLTPRDEKYPRVNLDAYLVRTDDILENGLQDGWKLGVE